MSYFQCLTYYEDVPANSSNYSAYVAYPLPYHFYQPYKINNEVTYFLTYMSIVLFLIIDAIVHLNISFLLTTTVFHFRGQVAILKIRIDNFKIADPSNFHNELADAIGDHNNIIWYFSVSPRIPRCYKNLSTLFNRLGEKMKKIFNLYLLGYFLTSTLILCLTNYQLLIVCILEVVSRVLASNHFNLF